ncbi:GAF domain-containing protein [Alkalimonas amylolytica]|nr:GAF domain-containing protein [Alkalimonas amylolytica]
MLDDKRQEEERLQVLKGYEILDTPPDGAFDRITALAARFFQVPIATVSLVDEDRIWFKSRFGLSATEVERAPGLCASAIFSDKAYVVKNAIDDPRSLANPLVVGALGLRFYAAVPLVTHDGHRLGTMNVIDFEPRDFNAENEAALVEFAGLVIDQMEVRLAAHKAIGSLTTLIKTVPELGIDEVATVCAWTKKILIDGVWYSFDEFLSQKLGLTITHSIHPDAAKGF